MKALPSQFRAAVALALLLAARPVAAQGRQSPWMPSIGGGVIEWSETGLSTNTSVGSSSTVVIRGSRDILGRIVEFEWGGAYASFREASRLDPTQTMAFDWRVQLHTPWEAVQPFVGAGPSLVMYMTNAGGRDRFYTAYNMGGGVRVLATPGLMLIIDARLRGWDFRGTDQWTQNAAGELTLSLGFRR